jgi:hypothetical protein
MAKTFKHSGDQGDIIFSLPAMRALGGGIFYLDPEGGLSNPMIKWRGHDRTRLNATSIDSLATLLARQPYITEVRHWKGEPIDYDLDQFRKHVRFNNLSDSHLTAFELPLTERDTAWLQVPDPIVIPNRPIVVTRSPRYQGNHCFWDCSFFEFKDRSVFVGHPKEHEIFMYAIGQEVPYVSTPDVLTLARVIAGAQQFVGNQGLPHAIAEGLKKRLINEYDRVYPAAIFRRPGAEYV